MTGSSGMWSSTPRERPQPRSMTRRVDGEFYTPWLWAVYLVVIGTLSFNLVLAFANTNVTSISENHVMFAELILLSAGLGLALNRKASLYVLLAVYLSYIVLILSVRQELDLKAIRDILIPIIFYFLGTRFRRLEDADRLIWISALVVLTIGFFEFFMLDLYTSLVDIFQYYVSRGTLSEDANFVAGSNLFISSTRVGGRYFLEFLGNIRASSVFLEPVTMGNFGAFLGLWALFRSGMAYRWLMFAAALTVVVLADARLGMFVGLAFVPVALVYRLVPKFAWWSVPFVMMFILALYGGWTREIEWQDNLPGRILHSAQIMMTLTPESIFGLASELPFVSDNGFAYTLTQIGILGMIALWTLYIYRPNVSDKAFQFKALAVTFICLNMMVSNSFYSIKLAALFWLAAGAADALARDTHHKRFNAPKTGARPAPDRRHLRFQPGRRKARA